MADKTIGSLPLASALTDDSSFVCEDNGEAKRVTGKQIKDYAKQGVSDEAAAQIRAVQSAGDTQVQRVTDEGTTQTANAKAQADSAAQSAAGAAQSAKQAAESAAVYDDVVADVNQLKQDIGDLVVTKGATEYANFIQGSVNADGTVKTTTKYRVSSEGLISLDKDITIYTDDTHKIALYWFTNGLFDGNYTKWVSSYNVPANKQFRVTIKAVPENTSEYINVDDTADSVSVKWRLVVADTIKSNTDRIDNLENCIDTDADIVKRNKDADSLIIQSRRPSNETHRVWESKPHVLSLLHFSDIHGHTNNLKRIMDYAEARTEYIDDVVCSGDMLYNSTTDDFTYWDNCNAGKVLTCIGNHDCYVLSSSSYAETQTNLYNRFFAPYKDDWGVMVGTNKTYYYKDYADSHIRLISIHGFLDRVYPTEHAEQVTWLSQTLAEAKTLGYSVVILQHYPMLAAANKQPTRIDCNFSAITGELSSGLPSDVLNAVDSFIDDGGEFICYLSGHTHFDYVGYNGVRPNQLYVGVANASLESQYSDFHRIKGTKSEDCFNVVSFDTEEKLLKIVRIGANCDNLLRARNSICINYKTKDVISQT